MDPIIEPLNVIPTNLPTLTAGADPITDQFGNLWNGLTDADGQVSFTFVSDGETDFTLSFSGYDIDTAIELSVWVNGVFVAYAGTGVDNGLQSYELVIDKAFLTGDDIITFTSNAPAYKWGVTDIAIEAYVPPPAPVLPSVTLDGDTNTEQFGNLWNGLTDADGEVSFQMISDGATDVTLSFKGFDIDTNVELEVYVNGFFLGHAGVGVDEGLASYTMEIDAALLTGDDVLTFASSAPAWKWGVTDVRIETSTGGPVDPGPTHPEIMVGGDTLTEEFGNLWNGLTDADGDVTYQFDHTGDDLTLSFAGFDIDTGVELEVIVNGQSIGFSGAGVNEGLADFEMKIDASLLVAGGNEITFRCSAPAYKWGVTDVRLDLYEAPPPPPPDPGNPVLVMGGDPITDQFGNLWNGMTDADGKVSFTVNTDGDSDLALSFAGFDIDTGIELEILVNGQSAGFSGQGVNEGLLDFTKIIDASLLAAGDNTITFRSSAPEWKWGVTDIAIDVYQPPVSTGLVLGGPTDGQAYGNIWMGMSNPEGEVSFDIDVGTGQDDIEVSFMGFDIDTDVELEVLINGVSAGFAGQGLDNALSFHQVILSSDLLWSSGNTITFRSSAPEWKWGVTEIGIEIAPDTVTPDDALWDQQWHMRMIGDLDRIWADYDGTGVKVGIYDDGIDAGHEDLASNFRADWNLVTSAGMLNPALGSGEHGTAVAGIIAGEADAEGVIGIAYGANFGSVDIFSGPAGVDAATSDVFFEALYQMANFDVVNNSWGATPGFDMAFRDMFVDTVTAFESVSETGRGGLGTILVKSAGNDSANSNGDLSDASRTTVTVAAIGETDEAALYSNWGSNILVTAPSSSGDLYGLGVVTTDLTDTNGFLEGYASGSYTGMDPFTGFGGTSASAPVVTGVVSLMLDAAPGLGWRDVHTILAYSATHTGLDVGETLDSFLIFAGVIDTTISEWSLNGADNWNGGGLSFSLAHGYGNVDAFNAVRMAEVWHLFTPEAQTSANEQQATAVVAGPFSVGASQTFTFDMSAESMTVEAVEISLALSDASVDVFLTSAAGTTMQLMFDGDAFGAIDWSFGAQGFRGEEITGEWTLEIVNTGFNVNVSDVQVEWFGSASTGENDVYHYTDEIFAGMIWQDGNQTGKSLTTEAARTTLSDGAGEDWIDAAAMQGDTILNLNAGATSSSGGLDFLTLAAGTVIENAVTGDGDDVITGNAAENELHGMRGDDTLDGGAGDDALYGGAGADQFIFSFGSGIDVIEDFEMGIDSVLLAGFGLTSFAQLTFGSDPGGNATLDLGFGDILVFQSLGGETFLAEDFQFGTVVA